MDINRKEQDTLGQDAELNVLSDEVLVQMAHEGSSTAEEYLIRKYMPLARGKAKVYFILGADSEDVFQEGMIGIFKAIRDFDPEGGASLKTFVDLCVTRQIITAVRKASKLKHRILTDSLSLDEEHSEGEIPLVDLVADRDPSDPEMLTLLGELTRSLDMAEQKLFSRFEMQVWDQLRAGFSYKEIAKVLDKSPKSVDNAIQRIRRKFKDYMEL